MAAQPRVARVNTLKLTLDAALAWLETPPPEHAKHAAKVGCVLVTLCPPAANCLWGTVVGCQRMTLRSGDLQTLHVHHSASCQRLPGPRVDATLTALWRRGSAISWTFDSFHASSSSQVCCARQRSVHR